MGKDSNIYIEFFAGISRESIALIREELFKNLNKLGLEGSYIMEEIETDTEMSINELMDILELEAEDNRELKSFIFAIRLNLKKSKVSSQKPKNDAALDAELASIEMAE